MTRVDVGNPPVRGYPPRQVDLHPCVSEGFRKFTVPCNTGGSPDGDSADCPIQDDPSRSGGIGHPLSELFSPIRMLHIDR